MLNATGFGVWESQESLPGQNTWVLIGELDATGTESCSPTQQSHSGRNLGIAAGRPSAHRLTGREQHYQHVVPRNSSGYCWWCWRAHLCWPGRGSGSLCLYTTTGWSQGLGGGASLGRQERKKEGEEEVRRMKCREKLEREKWRGSWWRPLISFNEPGTERLSYRIKA